MHRVKRAVPSAELWSRIYKIIIEWFNKGTQNANFFLASFTGGVNHTFKSVNPSLQIYLSVEIQKRPMYTGIESVSTTYIDLLNLDIAGHGLQVLKKLIGVQLSLMLSP